MPRCGQRRLTGLQRDPWRSVGLRRHGDEVGGHGGEVDGHGGETGYKVVNRSILDHGTLYDHTWSRDKDGGTPLTACD